MDNGPSQKMKFKLKIVVGGFVTLCFLILAVRIVYVACFAQINGMKYSEKAYSHQLSSEKIKANRGTIYDRNMVPLAQSATVWTVSVSPNEIKNESEIDKVATKLHEIFPNISYEKIAQKCKSKTKYEIIKKQCEKPEHDAILAFMEKEKIYSIHLTDDTKRYYPCQDLAAHTIGFCGADNQGLLGLELFYDKELRGTDGKVVSVQNGRGQRMPYKYEAYYPAKNGYNIITTLDANLQQMAQKTLETHCNYRKPLNRGLVAIMDATSSEILALAVWPSFDLNEPFELPDLEKYPKLEGKDKTEALNMHWKNKAISELYEPGSVFKIVTGAAVLEEKKMDLNQIFHCSGGVKVGPKYMHCWKRGSGHGSQNFTEVFINSCNPAFIAMGAALGPHKFFQYFKMFGLTSKTNIDLVGEATPLYIPENKLGPVELASESFGQSASVTPMHMIKAFSTIMNNGCDNGSPHLMNQIVDENGNTIKTYKPKKTKQVVSEQTAKTMKEILISVVDGIDNKGTNASVAGYKLAGKSGTAQKLSAKAKQKEGSKEFYVPSYIVCVDCNGHPYVAIVVIDSPTYPPTEYYGGVCAAPPAGELAKKMINHLKLPPEYSDEEFEQLFKPTPKCEGLTVQNARDKLFESEFKNFEFIGDGDTIVSQMPLSGTKVNKNTKIILYTQEISDDDKITVPNVIGLNQDQANHLLANHKLNMQISNSIRKPGRAMSQSPEPGTTVLKGQIVEVNFVMHDDNQD